MTDEPGEAGDRPHRAGDPAALGAPVKADPLESYVQAGRLSGLVIRGKAVLLLNCHLLLLLCVTGPAIGSA
jgi:hypothetical protein